MNDKIRAFVHSHKHLDYLQKCIRRMDDDVFVQKVLDMESDPNLFHFRNLGKLNPEKYLYVIDLSNSFAGFFAYFRWTISLLYVADYFNLVPVVYYGGQSPYMEDQPVNGTENGFEYYFKSINGIGIEDAKHSQHVCFATLQQVQLFFLNEENISAPPDSYFCEMGKICKKHIDFNEIVGPQLTHDMERLLAGKKTLGVQVRGTDYKLNYNMHPVCISGEEYLPIVRKAIDDYGFEQIFLATDEADVVTLFQKEFGSKVMCYADTVRSTDGTNSALSSANRKHHQYLLGLEVVRDVWTLAHCNGLLGSRSNIAISARIVKESFEQTYEYLYIIDKGLHNNNNGDAYYRKNNKRHRN